MAKCVNYYDKLGPLECPRCGWTGAFDAAATQVFAQFTDAHCPQCEFTEAPMLAIRMHPTLGEMIEYGTPDEVERAQRLLAEDRAFWKVALNRAEQLPDLPGEDDLYLVWDAEYEEGQDQPQTVIRHGDQVLFREPASWEAVDNRYEQICKILREKYGTRVRDLIPTVASELWLYGDKMSGSMFRSIAIANAFGR